MTKFLLVDAMNTLFRSKHVTQGNMFDKAGLSLAITIKSIHYAYKKFECDNIIFCLEGRNNWRKDFYPLYKANRAVKQLDRTQKDIDEDNYFFECANDFCKFIDEKTNITVLKADKCEADDFIARFIQIFSAESDNKFIVVSSDSDFQQLIAENIEIFDGVNKKLYKHTGVYDERDNPILDKKTNKHLIINPEYMLFEKCIRGDSSDNVPSAYPGVREKGSSKKIGIIEAFSDRNTQGYAYINFFNSKWIDQNNIEHIVKDDFDRNKTLIDLTQQPKEIVELLDKTILNACENQKNNRDIGVNFLKFCGKHSLNKLSENCDDIVKMFSKNFVI